MKKLLLAIILLASTATGTIHTIGQANIPFNASSSGVSAGDTVRLSENVSRSNGTVITMNIRATILDLYGYTVSFGSDNANSRNGILIQADYVRVLSSVAGGKILDAGDSTAIRYAIIGVLVDTPYDSAIIRDIDSIYVSGDNEATDDNYGTSCVSFSGNNFGCKIINCKLDCGVTDYYQRGAWPARAVAYGIWNATSMTTISNPEVDAHITVCSSTVIRSPHAGIYITGSNTTPGGVAHIFDNVMTLAARGDQNVSAADGGYRYGEAYNIGIRVWALAKIYNNILNYDSVVISTGDTLFGGNGIFLSGVVPSSYAQTQGYFSEIYGNTVRASLGEEGGNHSSGIVLRFSGQTKIYDNDIYCYSDTNSSTWWRPDQCNGIWLGYDTWGSDDLDSNLIYNNRIYALSGVGNAKTYSTGATYLRARGKNPAWIWKSYNNKVITDGSAYEMLNGGGTPNTVDSLLIVSDTIQWTDTASTQAMFMGTYVPGGGYFIGTDIVYTPVADSADTIITMAADASAHWFDLLHTLNLTVLDMNSQPVQNAVCTLWNNLGYVINTGTTDANGVISATERYWYEHRTAADSTNLQPFDFTVRAPSNADSIQVINFGMLGRSGAIDTTITFTTYAGEAPAPAVTTKKIRGAYIRKGKI